MERLDKILANSGVGTRKEVKNLIRWGAVKVDGKKAGQPGMIIAVDVDGYYGSLKDVTEYIAE